MTYRYQTNKPTATGSPSVTCRWVFFSSSSSVSFFPFCNLIFFISIDDCNLLRLPFFLLSMQLCVSVIEFWRQKSSPHQGLNLNFISLSDWFSIQILCVYVCVCLPRSDIMLHSTSKSMYKSNSTSLTKFVFFLSFFPSSIHWVDAGSLV